MEADTWEITAETAYSAADLNYNDSPLLPEVQNGTMVFPARSYPSKNVLMILGACPHQMGYPRNTTSYRSISATLPEMAG